MIVVFTITWCLPGGKLGTVVALPGGRGIGMGVIRAEDKREGKSQNCTCLQEPAASYSGPTTTQSTTLTLALYVWSTRSTLYFIPPPCLLLRDVSCCLFSPSLATLGHSSSGEGERVAFSHCAERTQKEERTSRGNEHGGKRVSSLVFCDESSARRETRM